MLLMKTTNRNFVQRSEAREEYNKELLVIVAIEWALFSKIVCRDATWKCYLLLGLAGVLLVL